MRTVLFIVLAIVPTLVFSAGLDMRVAALPIDRCELGEVAARLRLVSTDKMAAISEQVIPILEEISQLNSSATDSSKSVGEQLSRDDVGRWAKLTQRFHTMNLSQMIESRVQRDLDVIEKLVIVADQEYRWHKIPNEDDPDYVYHAIIQLLRMLAKVENTSESDTSVCSLNLAIHSLENEPMSRLHEGINQIDYFNSELDAILAKYGMTELDKSKLKSQDLEHVNGLINNIVLPLQVPRQFVADIENIKLMARASRIMYEENKQDIAFSGGDTKAIGMSLQRKMENGELDNNTQTAIGLWTKINEKIPCDFIKSMGGLNLK